MDQAREVLAWWNGIAKKHGLAIAEKVTRQRADKIRLRLAEGMGERLAEIEAGIEAHAFLRGENGRGWRLDLDYLVRNETTWLKVVEKARVLGGTESGPRGSHDLLAGIDFSAICGAKTAEAAKVTPPSQPEER